MMTKIGCVVTRLSLWQHESIWQWMNMLRLNISRDREDRMQLPSFNLRESSQQTKSIRMSNASLRKSEIGSVIAIVLFLCAALRRIANKCIRCRREYMIKSYHCTSIRSDHGSFFPCIEARSRFTPPRNFEFRTWNERKFNSIPCRTNHSLDSF